ncbi:MAG TPA: hypothetical protein VN851_09765 [Thermoanaerobaculia bacterium]|nr:hypothetical protein [Thermoanaerobaculia bacterium]
MKKRIAPLTLHRETLRSLVELPAEGAKAAPGTHYETICNATCDTQTNNQ